MKEEDEVEGDRVLEKMKEKNKEKMVMKMKEMK